MSVEKLTALQDTSDDTGSLPEIDPSEIEFDEKIGEGSYGQVFSGKCRGKDVAIKGANLRPHGLQYCVFCTSFVSSPVIDCPNSRTGINIAALQHPHRPY